MNEYMEFFFFFFVEDEDEGIRGKMEMGKGVLDRKIVRLR